jgi:hypothetical protein
MKFNGLPVGIYSIHRSHLSLCFHILAAANCIITIEQRVDPTRSNGDYLIDLKIIARSSQNIDKAQKLIKDFEEQKYSTRKIQNNDINLLTDQAVRRIFFTYIFKNIEFRSNYWRMNVARVMFRLPLINQRIQLN